MSSIIYIDVLYTRLFNKDTRHGSRPIRNHAPRPTQPPPLGNMDGAMAYQLVQPTDSFWNASRPRTRRRALLAAGCPPACRCSGGGVDLGPLPTGSGRTAAPNSIECLGVGVRRDILLDR